MKTAGCSQTINGGEIYLHRHSTPQTVFNRQRQDKEKDSTGALFSFNNQDLWCMLMI